MYNCFPVERSFISTSYSKLSNPSFDCHTKFTSPTRGVGLTILCPRSGKAKTVPSKDVQDAVASRPKTEGVKVVANKREKNEAVRNFMALFCDALFLRCKTQMGFHSVNIWLKILAGVLRGVCLGNNKQKLSHVGPAHITCTSRYS